MPRFSQTHERTISAPPATIHALINDFRQWQKWSPWEALDPNLERTYSGSEQGVGAVYKWSGNKQAGQGRMEITSSEPNRIGVHLQFLKPFKATNTLTFDLMPREGGTHVSWNMRGQRNLLFAVAGKLFFDAAIGKDFENGLDKLQAAAE